MSDRPTPQAEVWSGEFGAEYTRRNSFTLDEYDALYLQSVGVRRSALNAEFLEGLPRDARILEVGTNVGCQLGLLERAGFNSLWGVELQWGAVDEVRRRVPRANIVQGTALEIPFRDGFFDVVFTSGVLIHISPGDLDRALGEVMRCSRRYIWGDEYYAETLREIPYRGQQGLLWKGDYEAEYLRRFPTLRRARKKLLDRPDGTQDLMFLLEKPA
jgi:pseudaminic acid biosynthesis-associated methylase